MSDTTTTNTNALGDTPPTVCPRCAGPCTLPGEGPTGQLGGLCTVCGWDYLVAADDVTDGGDPVTGTPDLDRLIVAGMANLPVVLGRAAHVQGVQLHALDDALGETGAALRILSGRKMLTVTELAALADELGTRPSELLRQAEAAGAIVSQAAATVGTMLAVGTLVCLVLFDDVVIPRRDDGDRQ